MCLFWSFDFIYQRLMKINSNTFSQQTKLIFIYFHIDIKIKELCLVRLDAGHRTFFSYIHVINFHVLFQLGIHHFTLIYLVWLRRIEKHKTKKKPCNFNISFKITAQIISDWFSNFISNERIQWTMCMRYA